MFYTHEHWTYIQDAVDQDGVVSLGDLSNLAAPAWFALLEDAIAHNLIVFTGDEGPSDTYVARFKRVDQLMQEAASHE